MVNSTDILWEQLLHLAEKEIKLLEQHDLASLDRLTAQKELVKEGLRVGENPEDIFWQRLREQSQELALVCDHKDLITAGVLLLEMDGLRALLDRLSAASPPTRLLRTVPTEAPASGSKSKPARGSRVPTRVSGLAGRDLEIMVTLLLGSQSSIADICRDLWADEDHKDLSTQSKLYQRVYQCRARNIDRVVKRFADPLLQDGLREEEQDFYRLLKERFASAEAIKEQAFRFKRGGLDRTPATKPVVAATSHSDPPRPLAVERGGSGESLTPVLNGLMAKVGIHDPKHFTFIRCTLLHDRPSFNLAELQRRLGKESVVVTVGGIGPTMTGALRALEDCLEAYDRGQALEPNSEILVVEFVQRWGRKPLKQILSSVAKPQGDINYIYKARELQAVAH